MGLRVGRRITEGSEVGGAGVLCLLFVDRGCVACSFVSVAGSLAL